MLIRSAARASTRLVVLAVLGLGLRCPGERADLLVARREWQSRPVEPPARKPRRQDVRGAADVGHAGDARRRGAPEPPVRRPDQPARARKRRRRGSRPRGHSGGIRLQPARAIAQGRHGSHAADAGDRSAIRRQQSVQSWRERSCRRRVPAPAPESLRQQRAARARRLQRRTGRRRPSRPDGSPVPRDAGTTCRGSRRFQDRPVSRAASRSTERWSPLSTASRCRATRIRSR